RRMRGSRFGVRRCWWLCILCWRRQDPRDLGLDAELSDPGFVLFACGECLLPHIKTRFGNSHGPGRDGGVAVVISRDLQTQRVNAWRVRRWLVGWLGFAVKRAIQARL